MSLQNYKDHQVKTRLHFHHCVYKNVILSSHKNITSSHTKCRFRVVELFLHKELDRQATEPRNYDVGRRVNVLKVHAYYKSIPKKMEWHGEGD